VRIKAGSRRDGIPLAAIVCGGTCLNALLALPIGKPRIFGDELIYWQLSRAFAWTGHFTVRGGSAPRYGYVYPAVLAVAQRVGSDQAAAYAIAQGLNAAMFALTAVPVYVLAARVLTRRYALLAASLAVVLPSCIYTSALMTENAFYPVFVTCAVLMVRALERPSPLRQLLVVVAVLAAFLTRAQAVVLLPAYLVAALAFAVLSTRSGRLSALGASARRYAPTFAVVCVGAIVAATTRGSTTLGPYHVLLGSYSPAALVHWALANLADAELYVGVVPLAAFGVLLLRQRPLPTRVVHHTVLTACLGAGMLATVAVLSVSSYGLGRVHERNLFYLTPLVVIAFLAWVEAGMPRPRRTVSAVAVVLILLPLTIPALAVQVSGEDGLALTVWGDAGIRPTPAIAGMVGVAALAMAVFFWGRRPAILLGLCVAAFAATLVVAERHAVDSAATYRDEWRDSGWIDRAVGPDARVVALWATRSTGRFYPRLQGLWADEFYNRSVRDVASADGPLPDGLPVEQLQLRSGGCLAAAFPFTPQYAVVESTQKLAAAVVATSPSKRATLYRLAAESGSSRCLVHVRLR
jgi:hypothetical protein